MRMSFTVKNVLLSVLGVSGVQVLDNIPPEELETLIKIITQIGVGIVTIILQIKAWRATRKSR